MGRSSKELRRLLLDWAKKDKTVVVADFYNLFVEVMDHPTRYGFNAAKVSEGCIEGGLCVNAEEHIWFDNVSQRRIGLNACYMNLTRSFKVSPYQQDARDAREGGAQLTRHAHWRPSGSIHNVATRMSCNQSVVARACFHVRSQLF